jgi:hypothetical protein
MPGNIGQYDYLFIKSLLKIIIIDDGPTKNLMEIMGKDNFNAPADW